MSSGKILKICAIAAGIKSQLLRKGKNQKSAKSKLNTIKVLTFKALINASISHDEFVLINNVLKEYDNIKDKIKNLKN